MLKASDSRGDFSGVQNEMSEELRRGIRSLGATFTEQSEVCGAGEPQAEGHAEGGCCDWVTRYPKLQDGDQNTESVVLVRVTISAMKP